MRSLRAWAVPLVVPVGPASRLFDVEDNRQDDGARRLVATLGIEVVRSARRFAAGKIAKAHSY